MTPAPTVEANMVQIRMIFGRFPSPKANFLGVSILRNLCSPTNRQPAKYSAIITKSNIVIFI